MDGWMMVRHKLERRRRALLFRCSTERWPADRMDFIPELPKSHVGRAPEMERLQNTHFVLV